MSPVAAEASRFAFIDMVFVATGGCEESSGTVIALVAPDGLTVPFVAIQPCTRSPELSTSCPEELRVKVPSRVYKGSPELFCTTKNPLP